MALLDLGFMLPFFLILAVVYGALEVSGVFKNKGVKGIIAIVFGFFGATSTLVTGFLIPLLPYLTIFFLAFFLIGFVISALKGDEKKERKIDWSMLGIIAMLALLLLSSGVYEEAVTLSENVIGTAALAAVGMIFYSIYKRKGD